MSHNRDEWNIFKDSKKSSEENKNSSGENFEMYFDFSDLQEMEDANEIELIIFDISPNFSLINIHRYVREDFCCKYTNYRDIEKQLERCEKKRLPKILELLNKKKEFESFNFWTEYCQLAIPILTAYFEIIPDDVKGIISNRVMSSEEKIEVLRLIIEYSKILKFFFNVKEIYPTDVKNTCPICFKEHNINFEGKCSCGMQIEFIHSPDEDLIQEMDPIKQTNVDPKPQMDWLNYFLGNGSFPSVNEEFLQKMDRICVKKGYPTSQEVIERPELGTSELLLSIMNLAGEKNTKLKNIIGKRYWEWELPVMTEEQISQFEQDCITTRNARSKISDTLHNINLDITGYYLMGAQRLKFDRKFYKFPEKNSRTIEDANSEWKKVCEQTGIRYKSLK